MESVTPPILSLNLLGDINSGGYFAKWHSLYTSRPRPVNKTYLRYHDFLPSHPPPTPSLLAFLYGMLLHVTQADNHLATAQQLCHQLSNCCA
ncbi:hypothetical protein J6590_035462 [Homalodisca vitripennis]|nr:hypothetical protein J6590_035462 [Homalodisca vitripennis]